MLRNGGRANRACRRTIAMRPLSVAQDMRAVDIERLTRQNRRSNAHDHGGGSVLGMDLPSNARLTHIQASPPVRTVWRLRPS